MMLKNGSKGNTVKLVQGMLNFLGIKDGVNFNTLKEDGIYGARTEAVVIAFQRSCGLLADGIVGPITMEKLENEYSLRQLEINTPGVEAVDPNPAFIGFSSGPADAYRDGYNVVHLRKDVLTAYMKVYDEVHRCGGILTSSGGKRSLNASASSGRSATSMHYLGRALDLMIGSGMENPNKDPYVVSREKECVYRVYARCSQNRNSDKDLPAVVTVKNAITYSDRKKGITVKDHLLDLTSLFKKYGFSSIRAKSYFEGGGEYIGAEWWHFQYEKGLERRKTKFGDELLKVYPEEKLKGTPPWKYKEKIFGIDWN